MPVAACAEWRPDILQGRGGVEVVIDARRPSGEGAAKFPVWISALPSDLRKAMVVQAPNRTVSA